MKNYLYRGLLYGWHNFRSWVIDLRTICVFLCVMIFLYENILGVATFANSYNLGFTPWLLPFMATTRIVDLVLWLALLLLLCDLGVEKRFDIYVQLRLPVWALRIGRLFAAFLRVSFFGQSFQPVQFFCFLDTLNGIRTGERLLELWHVIYQKIYLELTPSVSHQ